jgi:hypothetical protein
VSQDIHFEVPSATRKRAEWLLEAVLPRPQHTVPNVLFIVHCLEISEEYLAIHWAQLLLQHAEIAAAELPQPGGEVLENVQAILYLVLQTNHAATQQTEFRFSTVFPEQLF